jgi:2-methylcitrate dehydratase
MKLDDLAEFVVRAQPADIGHPELLRRNLLDSVACAIAALGGETLGHLRDQIDTVGGTPRATLIGGGRTSVDQAALYNSVAVRSADLLDTYLTPGGLCHPADNIGALLAAAESVKAGGADFLLAMALAYEVQCRFSAAVPVMARGLNHALQLAISVAAGTARLYGLDAGQTANAIAMAASDNVSLAAIHSEPVSNWKGVSPGITAQRAVYTTGLARLGVTGPRGLFEGPNGLEQLFGQAIDLRLDDRRLNVVEQTHLKQFSALIHGQAPIEAMLTLADGVDPDDVDRVEVAVFQTAYDIAGGGTFGSKDTPRTKEQADYNLKYLLAAALLDGHVGPDQLRTERVVRSDVQSLLRRITVHPDDALTAAYPRATPVRIDLWRRDGHHLSRAQDDFHGAATRPFDWARTVEKFHWLAEGHAERDLRDTIITTVAGVENTPISALTDLLTHVHLEEQR